MYCRIRWFQSRGVLKLLHGGARVAPDHVPRTGRVMPPSLRLHRPSSKLRGDAAQGSGLRPRRCWHLGARQTGDERIVIRDRATRRVCIAAREACADHAVSARRVSNAGHEIVGWPAVVEGENRRRDNEANRGGADERNARTARSITSFVGLALPHVRSMRRSRQPDAIARRLRAQGSVGRTGADQPIRLDLPVLED